MCVQFNNTYIQYICMFAVLWLKETFSLLKFYILSNVTSPFGGTTIEREPLLYRTLRISQLSEIEPLMLASIVGGYMVTPYDFNKFVSKNEDDDNYYQVCFVCG